jgi:hypothetical protein
VKLFPLENIKNGPETEKYIAKTPFHAVEFDLSLVHNMDSSNFSPLNVPSSEKFIHIVWCGAYSFKYKGRCAKGENEVDWGE